MADAVEQADDFGGTHHVADAQASQAIGFGEGSRDHHLAAGCDEGPKVSRGIEVFGVSFIEAEDDVFRQGFRQGDDFLGVIRATGGVVGAGEEDEAGPLGDGGAEGLEVVTIARHRHFHRRGAEEHRREFVDDEGLRTEDDFVARAKEGLGEQNHHFIRAIADDEILGLHRPVRRQLLAEEGATTVGVEMADLQGLLGGGQAFRRWSQGVLVGSQLDDRCRVQTELAGYDLDGTASLIDGLRQDGPIGQFGISRHGRDHQGCS